MDEHLIIEKEACSPAEQQPLRDFLKGCWVLFVYCMFSTIQCTLWATPGPISTTMLAVYPKSITAFDIQFFLNWGTIMFILCSVPFAYWMSRPHGLRRCTIAGIVLITLGAACRCGAQKDDTLSLVLWHLSSVFIGAAGPAAMGAPSLLAEVWFPPAHRGIAMALAAEANSIGGAIAFAMPSTLLYSDTLKDLNHVYELCLGLCLFCCACALYFPDAPSVPPSKSAAIEHSASGAVTLASMGAALWRLVRNRQFAVIVLVYAVTGGFNSAWSSTLNLNLSQVGVSQNMAGYIGLASTVVGNVVGVIAGAYVDRFHRMKPTLAVLNVINVVSLVLFAVVVEPSLSKGLHLSPSAVLGLVWASAVSSGMALNGAIPLFFELAVENAFPVSTAFVIMAATTAYNLATLVMLFVPVSTAAAAFNWAYVSGCAAVTLTLIIFYREQSKRYDFDTKSSVTLADVLGADGDGGGGLEDAALLEAALTALGPQAAGAPARCGTFDSPLSVQ